MHQVDLYLDNDSRWKTNDENFDTSSPINNQGQIKAIWRIQDVNDWLIDHAKKELVRRRQDVFLLPQKQTGFYAPDELQKKIKNEETYIKFRCFYYEKK